MPTKKNTPTTDPLAELDLLFEENGGRVRKFKVKHFSEVLKMFQKHWPEGDFTPEAILEILTNGGLEDLALMVNYGSDLEPDEIEDLEMDELVELIFDILRGNINLFNQALGKGMASLAGANRE